GIKGVAAELGAEDLLTNCFKNSVSFSSFFTSADFLSRSKISLPGSATVSLPAPPEGAERPKVCFKCSSTCCFNLDSLNSPLFLLIQSWIGLMNAWTRKNLLSWFEEFLILFTTDLKSSHLISLISQRTVGLNG
ncbi:hypothetical protein WICPIJ_002423, partial [Wickerhamomyces pijperi]